MNLCHTGHFFFLFIFLDAPALGEKSLRFSASINWRLSSFEAELHHSA